MQNFIRHLGEVWYILMALVTIVWFMAISSADIQNLKASDAKQDLRLEAINTDITQIKVDTSYIRAVMERAYGYSKK